MGGILGGAGGAGGAGGLSSLLNPLLFKSAQNNNPFVNPLFAQAVGWKPYNPITGGGGGMAPGAGGMPGPNATLLEALRRAGITDPAQIQQIMQKLMQGMTPGPGAGGGGSGLLG